MEKHEEVYIAILERLPDICIRNGTGMWLTGGAALGAYRSGRLMGDDVAVCVPAKDVPRLARAVKAEADAGFDVESPLSEPEYPANELRVFDPRTTDCDTSDFFKYKNNCMHVMLGQIMKKMQKNQKPTCHS